MTWVVLWPVVFPLSFALLAVVVRSSAGRRRHFWVRVLAFAGLPAALPLVLGGNYIVAYSCALTLIITPSLLYKRAAADSGWGDDPGDDGSPLPPGPPLDGIPLPDAEQSSTRVRDHDATKRRWHPTRRPRVPA